VGGIDCPRHITDVREGQRVSQRKQHLRALARLRLRRSQRGRAQTRVLKKRLLVDLLNISDPDGIGGPLAGVPVGKFAFPLQSVESLTPIDDRTLLVGLDNNYPSGNSRVPGTPDNTEIITLHSRTRLKAGPKAAANGHVGCLQKGRKNLHRWLWGCVAATV
jgi:hypothetical protein